MKKKIAAITLCIGLMMNLIACGGSSASGNNGAEAENSGQESKPISLSLSHMRPDGSPVDLALEAFCKEANELSGGTLTFEIFPASQLGDYTVVQERVMLGDIDIQCATIGTNIDKMFGMSTAPYLATNWDEAREIYASDGILANAFREKLDEYGLTFLTFYPLYFGGIALDSINPAAADPNGKSGIKIRVPSMIAFEKTAVSLGYLATPLASSDMFTSMQTGVIDGALGMGAEGYYSNMADLVKQYLPINDHFEAFGMYINSEKFSAMSKKQQDALTTAAMHMEEARWEVAEEETQEYEQKLRDKGAEVVNYTDEELDAFADKIRTEVWPLIRDEYDTELFDKLTGAIGEAGGDEK